MIWNWNFSNPYRTKFLVLPRRCNLQRIKISPQRSRFQVQCSNFKFQCFHHFSSFPVVLAARGMTALSYSSYFHVKASTVACSFFNFYFAVLHMNLSVLKASVWFLSIGWMLNGIYWYLVSDTLGIRSLWILVVPAILIEYIMGFIQEWQVCPFCIINYIFSHKAFNSEAHF